MNASDALKLLNQSLAAHQLNSWSGGLDNARRRFGVCRIAKKQIGLSRHLCELNSEAEVIDTILHEIAHALAWERHGENCGHDKRWKAICVEIGARPVACFDNEVIQPKAPWILVNRETGDIYRTYYKRPSRDWSEVWIRGLKAQTYGKLELRANTVTPTTGDLFPNDTNSGKAAEVNPTDTENAHANPINRFTAESVAEFRTQLLDQIDDLTTRYGLQVSKSKGRYSDTECNLTLTFTVPVTELAQEELENNQRTEFEALASLFELTASHYRSTFRVNGEQFKLIGFKPNNRRYPVIGIDGTGKQYKFEESVLDQIEG